MAIALGHAQIDRKVGTARECHGVVYLDMPRPILLRQAIDADPSTEPTTLEYDGIIGKRLEVDLSGDHIRFKPQRAAARLSEPQIDAGEISGGHGAPRQRAPRRRFPYPPLGIEEVDRREASEA